MAACEARFVGKIAWEQWHTWEYAKDVAHADAERKRILRLAEQIHREVEAVREAVE